MLLLTVQRKISFAFSSFIGRKKEAIPSLEPEEGSEILFLLLKEITSFFSQPQWLGPQASSMVLSFDGSVYRMSMLLLSICLGKESKLISECEKLADSISDCDFTSK